MRWLRVLMLWMLALALPVQGMAAVAMLHCDHQAPARQAAATDVAQIEAHADHHGHVHGLHKGHVHDGESTGAASQGAVAQASHDAASHTHAAGHSCSACAACCVALALPPAMPVLATALTAPTSATTLVAPSPSFLTAGPERPPRSLHA